MDERYTDEQLYEFARTNSTEIDGLTPEEAQRALAILRHKRGGPAPKQREQPTSKPTAESVANALTEVSKSIPTPGESLAGLEEGAKPKGTGEKLAMALPGGHLSYRHGKAAAKSLAFHSGVDLLWTDPAESEGGPLPGGPEQEQSADMLSGNDKEQFMEGRFVPGAMREWGAADIDISSGVGEAMEYVKSGRFNFKDLILGDGTVTAENGLKTAFARTAVKIIQAKNAAHTTLEILKSAAGGATQAGLGLVGAYKDVDPPEETIVREGAYILTAGILDSWNQFVNEPEKQMREHPFEYAFNLADLAAGSGASFRMVKSTAKALDIAGDVTRAATAGIDDVGRALKALPPELQDNATDKMVRALDDVIAKVDDMTPEELEAAGDADVDAVREVTKQRVRDFRERVKEFKAERVEEAGEDIQKAIPGYEKMMKAYRTQREAEDTVEMTKFAKEAGEVNVELLLEFGSRSASAAVGGFAANTSVNAATGERDFHPAAVSIGMGIGALVGSPKLFKGDVDFEKIMGPPIKAMLAGSQKVVNQRLISNQAANAVVAGGAGAGLAWEEGDDLYWNIAKSATAGFLFAGVGHRITRPLAKRETPINFVRAYEKFFEVGGDLPNVDVPIPGYMARRMGIDGDNPTAPLREVARHARIKMDARKGVMLITMQKFREASTPELGRIMRYLNDGTNRTLQSVAPEFRDSAASMRWLFDEITLDLLELDAVSGKLANAYIDNIGRYLPRVYLDLDRQSEAMTALNAVNKYGRHMARLGEQSYNKGRWETKTKAINEKLKPLQAEFKDLTQQIKDRPDLTNVLAQKRATVGKKIEKLEKDKAFLEIDEDQARAWGLIDEANPDPGYILGSRGPILAADAAAQEIINTVRAAPDLNIDPKLADSVVKHGRYQDRANGKEYNLFTRRYGSDRQKAQKHIREGDKIYRQMPDSPRYGTLRNRFVDEDVADSLMTRVNGAERPGIIGSIGEFGTAFFKAMKVQYNPATLVRNFFGQVPLSDFGGVRPYDVKMYRETYLEMRLKNGAYLEAIEEGLFGGEFINEEIMRFVGDSLDNLENIWDAPITLARKLTAQIESTTGKVSNVTDKIAGVHQFQERWARLMLYKHAKYRKGMSTSQAIAHAKKYAFDYRDVPEWVKLIRKAPYGAPFISFSYKAMPRVIEAALAVGDWRKMGRFWKYPALFAMWNEVANQSTIRDEAGYSRNAKFMDGVYHLAAEASEKPGKTAARLMANTLGMAGGRGDIAESFGLGSDNYKSQQEFLPPYKGGQQIMSLSTDIYGRDRFVDLTYFLPWGDIAEIGKGNAGEAFAQMGVPFPRQLEPSNPWFQTGVAIVSGQDPFTQRPIDGDWGTFLLRQFGPQFLGYDAQALKTAMSGNVIDPNQKTVIDALLAFVGGRRTPVDPFASTYYETLGHRSDFMDHKDRAASLERRQASQGAIDRKVDQAAQSLMDMKGSAEKLGTLEPNREVMRLLGEAKGQAKLTTGRAIKKRFDELLGQQEDE